MPPGKVISCHLSLKEMSEMKNFVGIFCEVEKKKQKLMVKNVKN